jgi:hypothetical protein
LEKENRVRIYYNLHKFCYSVQSKTDRGWRLAFHAKEIALKNVKFKVYELARLRVVATQRKSPHAYVIGKQIEPKTIDNPVRVRYNPFVHSYFFCENGSIITQADYVLLNTEGVYINGF